MSAATSAAAGQNPDTVFADVGSHVIDARLFKPHAARVRIYRGDTLVGQWTNELSLGDSAGRRVMRWVTTGEAVPANPNRPLGVLRQTYDAVTLAPLGYSNVVNSGASSQLRIDGRLAVDYRVFTVQHDTTLRIEGSRVVARKVEKRRRSDRSLTAYWYLLTESP